MIGLLSFHIYLLFTNQTTNETIKGIWKSVGFNPYKRTCIKNTYSVLCSRNHPKYFDPRSEVVALDEKITKSPSKEATNLPHHIQETLLDDHQPVNRSENIAINIEMASKIEVLEPKATAAKTRSESRPNSFTELNKIEDLSI